MRRRGKGAPLRQGHSRGFRRQKPKRSSEAACDSGKNPTGEDNGGNDHHSGEEKPANKNFGHRLLPRLLEALHSYTRLHGRKLLAAVLTKLIHGVRIRSALVAAAYDGR